MAKLDPEEMDFEELWLLYEGLTKILAKKIRAETLELERRLAQLNPTEPTGRAGGSGPEPIDLDAATLKFCKNTLIPQRQEETWSGRGKRPRWLIAAVQSGHNLEEFRIPWL